MNDYNKLGYTCGIGGVSSTQRWRFYYYDHDDFYGHWTWTSRDGRRNRSECECYCCSLKYTYILNVLMENKVMGWGWWWWLMCCTNKCKKISIVNWTIPFIEIHGRNITEKRKNGNACRKSYLAFWLDFVCIMAWSV